MTDGRRNAPAVLVILDGWGLREADRGNAIAQAKTPVFDRLWASYPKTTLKTSGRDVGLPPGQMGNSEVGHLNLGAGFIVFQSMTRIDMAIENGEFLENAALVTAMQHARETACTVHLLGLVSDGGVHSHISHIDALLHLAARQDVETVAIHAILDGRDTSPTGGVGYLQQVQEMCSRRERGRIASVIGRYYAMDRDKRWERTRRAYDLYVTGQGEAVDDPIEAVRAHYGNDETDEFMSPLSVRESGAPPTTIADGDVVIFFNFRADRARQITQALIGPPVEGVDFPNQPQHLQFVSMTEYADYLHTETAFPAIDVVMPLARVVSEAGLWQFHTAETEKYAHVTYFFNGGREEPFPGEDRKLSQSPKVATYDLQPEMSAPAVGQATVDAITSGMYDFVIVNFANCDMVGHTGVIPAAVRATEAVDTQLGRIVDAVMAQGGTLLVTADHGNAEEMLVLGTDKPMTAHTTNPVPFILVAADGSPLRRVILRDGGRLADVAPTVLDVLGIPQPSEMTGESLIEARSS